MLVSNRMVHDNNIISEALKLNSPALMNPKIHDNGIRLAGTLFVWGNGDSDQLPSVEVGKATLPEIKTPTAVPTDDNKKFIDVVCGAMHTALISHDRMVFTFGSNDDGALGRDVSNDSQYYLPTPLSIKEPVLMVSCGDSHTAVLTVSGKVFLCGSYRDSSGKLGFPDFQHRKIIDKETLVKPVTDITKNIIKICSGDNHTIALGNDCIFVWGNNEFGQLMLDEKKSRTGEPELSVQVRQRLLWPTEVPIKELGVKNLLAIQDVFTGAATTFVVSKKQNRLFGCGRNGQGEVGIASDEVIIWGLKELNVLSGRKLLHIEGGQYFTVALEDNGNLWSWGSGIFTGHGLPTGRISVPEMVGFDEPVRIVSCGSDHCFAISSTGKLYSWGSRQNFILGDSVDSAEPQLVPAEVNQSFTNGVILKGAAGCHHSCALVWDVPTDRKGVVSKKRKQSVLSETETKYEVAAKSPAKKQDTKETTEETQPAKKRGRKKKVVVAESPTKQKDSSESDPNRRRPGRPKKISSLPEDVDAEKKVRSWQKDEQPARASERLSAKIFN